jgi:hypothetical protein
MCEETIMNSHKLDELSGDELQRIERLVDSATPGPWMSYLAARDGFTESMCIELGSCNELGSFSYVELIGCSRADQEFIASARQDVPRLLREVHALRARLRALLCENRRAPGRTIRGVLDAPVATHLPSM